MNGLSKKVIVLGIIIFLLGFSIIPIITGNQVKNNLPLSKELGDSFNDLNFDLKIKFLMRIGHFPSLSVCIIKNNSIIWYKGYGKARFLTKPTIDTVYPIGSISKTFVGTAMMQLYEDGLFELDDDVNDYLDFEVRNPNFPDIPITFRMLLAHQSSLTGKKLDFDLHFSYWFLKYKSDYPYPMIKEIITPNGNLYRSSFWENFPPGSDCAYSNCGMMLLEHLFEVLSNQNFIDYCQENIFDPLNMSNTSFFFEDFKRSQLASAYHNIGNLYFRIPSVDIPYGVGGIKCSMKDFSHYAIAHMNGGVWNGVRILNETTVELMHTKQYPDCSWNDDERFGLGWVNWDEYKGINLHGHCGHPPGATSVMWINASNDWAALFFTNIHLSFSNPLVSMAWDKIGDALFLKAKDF